MLNHRSVPYDSIGVVGEETSLVASPTDTTTRRPHSSTKKLVILATLMLLGVVVLAICDPTSVDIPILSKSLRRHQAQSLADDFVLTYLSGADRKLKHHHHRRHDAMLKEGGDDFDVPDGCEATIVIVRHCEKTSIREHCSYVGYERSVYLATIFGHDDERWPMPSYIYALDAGQRHNPKKRVYREMETVLPLAVKSNVTVDYSYDTRHVPKMARNISSLLKSGDMCGKVAVICWKHSEIPHLAHKLGCGPTQGCPSDYPSYTFDQAWQIKFVYRKLSHSEKKNGRLPKHNVWEVYGNVEDEGFDPLAFSKQMGDYVPGGKKGGGSFLGMDVEIPEEGLPKDEPHHHHGKH